MPEQAVLDAIEKLEAKLTAIINTGLAGVTNGLAVLSEHHHNSRLEQAQKNATFADRDRVESINATVQDLVNKVQVNMGHIHELRANQKLIEQAAIDSTRAGTDRWSDVAGKVIGFMATAILLVSIAILTYLLTHGVHG